MKKKLLYWSKILGFILFYAFVLFMSTFITMSFLIKGDELETPDLTGKSLKEAYTITSSKGLFLKKIVGNFDRNYKPMTVITQMPVAGVRIKEKSFIKVFVSSEVVEVIVPNLNGLNLAECEKRLLENDLKKRYIAYMNAVDVPVDSIISQSIPAGSRVNTGAEVDLLISRGPGEISYIMPDIIGKRSTDVQSYFDSLGLKISKMNRVSYPGLEPGVVIKQYPLSGYRINDKARISIEVSL
jgi:eukaryotic-like serine/threonine-protein kinase